MKVKAELWKYWMKNALKIQSGRRKQVFEAGDCHLVRKEVRIPMRIQEYLE
jgi:hypothetical protein